MTIRERIHSVYHGETPDVVPFMLDLSHWFYHREQRPWDLSIAYEEPERDLIDFHREVGAGFYMPNLAGFFETSFPDDVKVTTVKSEDGTRIMWSYETPLGTLTRVRHWEEQNYAWGIADWAVKTQDELAALGYALSQRQYTPLWERFRAWDDYAGDVGVVYITAGYSAMGHLLNYWMGVEGTLCATMEWPEEVRTFVDSVNANFLECIDLLAQSPADIVCLGDNFSSDIQPPHFFAEWSRPFYQEAIARLHAAGKQVAVHIDGRLRGAVQMFSDIGADCADAVTPGMPGDLTPKECRAEAGPNMVLSGGVPPNLWSPDVDIETFKAAVLRWLDLREKSPRLIANAGDQVPPGAEEGRIHIMRDLVEKHGRF